MKKINLIMFRKKFFLFVLLCISIFLMNLFLWNETSQLVRSIPLLTALKDRASDDFYEFRYRPNVNGSGMVKEYTEDEKNNIYEFLLETFYESDGTSNLFIGKNDYILNSNEKWELQDMTPVTTDILEEQIGAKHLSPTFFNDILVSNIDTMSIKEIERSAEDLNFHIRLYSFEQSFQETYDYYFGNFMFGLVFSLVFLSFSLLIVYLVISSSFKLLKDEIKMLRVIGLSNKKLVFNFSLLFMLPVIMATILFTVIVYSARFNLILADIMYLFLINMSVILFIILIVWKKMRGILNVGT